MVHLITGYAGKPHVTSSSDGAVNMGMYGKGKYILNIGEKFGYEIVSNNIIKIKSGYAINQGRKIEIAINDYEEVTIDNGLQGMKRCDLIVLRYEKSPDSGIETASLAVIKGISSDTYVAPTYSEGDILAGEGIDDFLLYKVFISGLSIEKVETQFTVTKSIMEILDEYKKMPSELDRMLGSLNTLSKYTTVHTPNPSIGPQIIQKENTESDIETGKPFPFPIQTVVEGHELALRQLNTESRQSTNGKFILPGGLMVQWGIVDYSGSLRTTFPEPYKQTPHVSVSPYYQTDASVVSATLLRSVDKNGFTTKNFYAIAGESQPWTENKKYTSGYSWIAIGY